MEAVQHGLFRPLGSGDAHIDAVVEALRRSGYSCWLVLEQDLAITGSEPPVGGGPTLDVRRRVLPPWPGGGDAPMKLSASLAVLRLVVAACGSSSDDNGKDNASTDTSGDNVELTQGPTSRSRWSPTPTRGSFWSVVKKGAEQAAKDEGVKLVWSPRQRPARRRRS